jgi:hypothetical protein
LGRLRAVGLLHRGWGGLTALGVCRRAEDAINRLAGARWAVRQQVRVGAKREPRITVAEILGLVTNSASGPKHHFLMIDGVIDGYQWSR